MLGTMTLLPPLLPPLHWSSSLLRRTRGLFIMTSKKLYLWHWSRTRRFVALRYLELCQVQTTQNRKFLAPSYMKIFYLSKGLQSVPCTDQGFSTISHSGLAAFMPPLLKTKKLEKSAADCRKTKLQHSIISLTISFSAQGKHDFLAKKIFPQCMSDLKFLS